MLNKKTIDLYTIARASSLSTRQIAREIIEVVRNSTEETIELDFDRIEFASRSFFDELYNAQSTWRLLHKHVELKNLNDHLKQLGDIVRKTAQSKSTLLYVTTASAKVVTI